ncbi:hypothetical protein VNO80_22273 [Phaseolus coccineus]|uniref:Uncharacterized protein n=1 Tax=Phaseolus coccineus TaxID=3886 RepID=A0AAN9QU40_PHACN
MYFYAAEYLVLRQAAKHHRLLRQVRQYLDMQCGGLWLPSLALMSDTSPHPYVLLSFQPKTSSSLAFLGYKFPDLGLVSLATVDD